MSAKFFYIALLLSINAYLASSLIEGVHLSEPDSVFITSCIIYAIFSFFVFTFLIYISKRFSFVLRWFGYGTAAFIALSLLIHALFLNCNLSARLDSGKYLSFENYKQFYDMIDNRDLRYHDREKLMETIEFHCSGIGFYDNCDMSDVSKVKNLKSFMVGLCISLLIISGFLYYKNYSSSI